jgi:hypothetical protein
MRRTLLILALIVFVAAPAGAQGLKLAFNQGLVSIDATSVPVRTILTEWGKLGGTNVVGAERIAGAPLTLKLVDVPEAQALDIVLRSVAGYMAAPRATMAGASIYDRILILATSSAPAPAAARPTPVNQNPNAGTQRLVPPRPNRQPANADEDEEAEDDPNPPNAPVFTFPPQGQPGQQPGGIFAPAYQPTGQPINVNPNTGGPQQITINPASPPTAPSGSPTTPFGVGGASTPGVIQAPPPQPGQPVRPPG